MRCVLQTGEGTVWVGNAVGLDRWREGTISRVSLSPSEGGRVLEQSVLALADAGDGGVWAGTYSQGVVRLDAQGHVLVRIGAADGLPSMSVRAVLPDGDDLWIGTTAGLVRWRNGKARRYTAADGVPDGSVQVLYRDAQGIVWIGTDRGVTALSPDGSTRAWLGEQDFPGRTPSISCAMPLAMCGLPAIAACCGCAATASASTTTGSGYRATRCFA